ncbi:hypothetical protein SAMN02983003_2480 [Devosia enhydra]|uniref:Uncharacterized protein n=1 Tax=Devosia enhydra TaxID=665118 RepID=A0A1K2HZ17_9HYPH|nr:hypothetical protein [Devosia enhydra]SFZ85270.1 hypothetical protein SAMN02983003_2480 [Devosia enhydra]
MKHALPVSLIAGVALWPLAAVAAPTAAQKAEFYSVCMGISGDAALCGCKADAAMTLVDERMMGYVIAGMKGAGNAPADIQKRWNGYVAESNRVCKPGY